MDSSGQFSKTGFELSRENFSGQARLKLSEVLESTRYTTASFARNLVLKKVQPGSYYSDLDPDDICKVYYDEQHVYITLNLTSNTTQVEKLNLAAGTYTNYEVPFARHRIEEGEHYDASSFLLPPLLFTAFIRRDGLSVGVYNLDSGKYIRQWGPDFASLDSMISSPLIFEKIANTETINLGEITIGKIDTFTNWDKFQKKMYSMPILSIAADKTSNGNIDIYVSGLSVIEKNGGAAVMMGGGGGAPMMMGGGYSMGLTSTYDEDQPKARKHCFFISHLSAGTLDKTTAGRESDLYRRFQMKYLERLNQSTDENFSKFNKGNKYYLGFYKPDQYQYVITEYK